MGYDLENKLVIAISSRALFSLEEENRIFEKQGLKEYYQHQLEKEHDILQPGTAFDLVNNFLAINTLFDDGKHIEVIIISRNNAATSLRITKSIEAYNLDIVRSAWTGGERISKYLLPFKVDLFLSAYEDDVRDAIDVGIAAARILPFEGDRQTPLSHQVRIAFDGDAVLFSDESEQIYKLQGLDAFIAHEKENVSKSLPDGPFAKLLRVISKIQTNFPDDTSAPIRTALITARNSPAHERVIRTLNEWGVRIDEAFFLGGVDKYEIVKAFQADIFFDDQDVHLEKTSKETPSAKVPYFSSSPLSENQS
ncbi:5'-nucleotidase [Sulfuricurvum sp.]|uniref:5'-nucleotidase n=1 Tax=Sulfuricurvum sp. TaxID=2025608 RepID=UPI00262C913A|nr:5'-nucleotidase [Sulfuricurvum sp.]MDD2780001.1 5'-nucleotidase [Sulfuricurvum sp.]